MIAPIFFCKELYTNTTITKPTMLYYPFVCLLFIYARLSAYDDKLIKNDDTSVSVINIICICLILLIILIIPNVIKSERSVVSN